MPDSAIVPTRQMPPPSGSGTPTAQRFPRPGEIVAHFRINSELGQGAFARVYLAEQLNLADRPVALKVSAALGDEPRNLARLQHTHIVPIHSVHDDPDTGWRLICMPYVGGANLAEILRGAGAYLPSLATGRSLIDALDRMGHGVSATGASLVETGPSRPDGSSGPAVISGEFALSSGESIDVATGGIGSPSRARSIWGRYFARLPWWNDLAGHDPVPNEQEEREPARRYLRSATYVQAAVWIVARLAEGLQHAHDRGLLHRDIKPSNILIAADGTPMLLDFNLSAELVEDPNEDGDQARARLGGTLPYMAPEHLDAFSGQGTTPPEAVGTAADIYALGLILFEMVAGQHPFSDPPPARRLGETIRVMLDERLQGPPSAPRAQPPGALGPRLDPEPLSRPRPEPPPCPRRRPCRRPPPAARRSPAEACPRAQPARGRGQVVATEPPRHRSDHHLLGLGGPAGRDRRHRVPAGRPLAGRRGPAAVHRLRPGAQRVPAHAEHLQRADRAPGPRAVSGGRGPGGLRPAPSRRLGTRPGRGPASRGRSSPTARTAQRADRAAGPRGSCRRNDDTTSGPCGTPWKTASPGSARPNGSIPNPSHALFLERARYHAALGETEAARTDDLRAAQRPPTSARDLSLLGTALLARGEADRAEALLNRAVTLNPERFWSWFALGLCHYQQARYDVAAHDFSVCTILRPNFPGRT